MPQKILPLLFLFLAYAAGSVNADDLYWNANTGKWEASANWSDGRKPTSTDNVHINNGGTAKIDSTTGTAAAGTTIGITANAIDVSDSAIVAFGSAGNDHYRKAGFCSTETRRF